MKTSYLNRMSPPQARNRVTPHIRWMIRKDLDAALAIEAACFEWPWDEDAFIRALRSLNVIGMVAEHEDRVRGFMIYELHRTKIRILNFAVHPTWQRFGIGTAMVNKLKSKLSTERRNRLMLEIRETNLPAHLFFKAQGFRATSVLKAFYEETPEDAYLFAYRYTRTP